MFSERGEMSYHTLATVDIVRRYRELEVGASFSHIQRKGIFFLHDPNKVESLDRLYSTKSEKACILRYFVTDSQNVQQSTQIIKFQKKNIEDLKSSTKQ
ncbi:MAG: hypothetical protein QXH32_02130 [Candidatus Caldarchaeum sp.]